MYTVILNVLLMFTFLLIDISQFYILNTPIIAIILPLYITSFFNNTSKYFTIIFGILFLLESFCFYGNEYFGLAILLPVTLGMLLTKRIFQHTELQPVLWTLCALLLQSVIIEQVFLRYKTPIGYTISKIFATLMVAYFFSLKDRLRGNRGNRM